MEAREKFVGLKPRLGGNAEPVRFTQEQAAILGAAADRIIPGGAGFPAPSEVGVVGFIGRYVTPSDEEPKWFPFAGEDDFKAEIEKLGEDFLCTEPAQQVEALERTQQESEAFFSQLRNLVYYGYYSRPEVTKAINENVEAGRDYRSPPQPYGYLDVIEDWDRSMLPRVKGTYIRTEDVRRTVVRTPTEPPPPAKAPPGEALGAQHPSAPEQSPGPNGSDRAD